jgi:hypothetical protein
MYEEMAPFRRTLTRIIAWVKTAARDSRLIKIVNIVAAFKQGKSPGIEIEELLRSRG